MSVKLICLLALFTLCATVIITEARGGGRGRGGSLGSAFYRRSHKKHASSGNGGSRRKIITGSPVHTSYTNSMFAAEGVDEKFAKHRSRHRSKHHKSTSSHSSSSDHSSSNSHSSSSSHKSSTHTDSHVSHKSHSTLGSESRHNTNNWYGLGSGVSHHNTHAASPHISHNWGGHQLPAGHVYVTQPSSIPVNAVYYAQPPRHTNTDDSTDFALGYLVGRSMTRRRHHHHHYEQQPQPQPNNQTEASKVIVVNNMNPAVVPHSTEQPHYWPTDSEISLAPLNNTLIPNGVTSSEPIFKSPPIVSAQTLTTAGNATFELPTATAPPPETPPTNGIICMPWSFNETDPTRPDTVVVVQKTICFPAPPAPPAPPTTTMAPIAGDISAEVARIIKEALA
ncbi:uncharacterized protein LOC105231118 isoform X2 [Bactrocera dorsalis]|uniref:Uncharacterized protein LOC105231118 isoform X2 n=1 Tax=Bactrocera dorsalis TaxID=27457 RepID=A0A6I9VIZ2_BACDO|nr:uncharacterized protein LOC105231118 isoform X3 [Bactrocera dorsalis]XP_049316947.1 uncharacterized protein LOC105231118 isoform X2 [Bactrocera dorsalis]